MSQYTYFQGLCLLQIVEGKADVKLSKSENRPTNIIIIMMVFCNDGSTWEMNSWDVWGPVRKRTHERADILPESVEIRK